MGCPHKDTQQECHWMRITEVVEYLDINRHTLYRLINREYKPLPARRIGGAVTSGPHKDYRVCLEMLKDWIEETNEA